MQTDGHSKAKHSLKETLDGNSECITSAIRAKLQIHSSGEFVKNGLSFFIIGMTL